MENQKVRQNEGEFFVEDDPLMQSATNALFMLSKLGRISIKAKGLDIPNAVAIANIITENFLKNNSKVEKINLDSKISDRDGRMISNIEIILLKN